MEQEKLIQTLEETITLIANEANPFDYSSIHYPTCDTPGCIAGWVAHIAVSKEMQLLMNPACLRLITTTAAVPSRWLLHISA